MKKLILFLFVALLTQVFTSCKDDDVYHIYRTFPQFLQKRSEEAFNVPQSGQYHLPSGIGSTGEGVWCAFAGV